jgi:hypothetical protein
MAADKLIVVSGRAEVADEDLPTEAKFFSRPHHDAAIVSGIVETLCAA